MISKWASILFYFNFILCVLFLYSCAAVKAPSGGPKDTTPPELIGSEPPQGTTEWKGGSIRLFFSEYMSETGLEKAFSISPKLKEEWKVELQGNVILIDIPGELEPNRTYILSMSRDLKDEHGVSLEKGSQIAFSTGNVIDSGEISGKLYDGENVSVHLWEWHENINRDSVYFSTPIYITDSGDDGKFSFQYLSAGRYCILGVGKESAGKPMGPAVFRLGLPKTEALFLIDKDTIANVNMRMKTLEPPLKITRTEFVDHQWGRLYFNGSVKELPLENLVQIIQEDTLLYIPEIFVDPENNKNLIFLVDSLIRNVKTEIKSQLTKIENEVILDSVRIKAKVPSNPDTSFLIIKNPGKSIKIKPDKDGGPPVEIIFSRPVENYHPSFTFALTKNDTDTVTVNLMWKSPMQINILPKMGWEENLSYSLTLESLDTLRYVTLEDSLHSIKINTRDRLGYGRLTGKIATQQLQHLAVEAISIENSADRYPTVVNSGSTFEINTLPSGKYTILFFQDADGSQNYSYGEVLPFKQAEWFYFYPDTIDIRANWDYEIKDIELGLE
ncbi:MAG: Ig-like domain-containing protein [Candidatus Marinimicrobia bacterium]|nr:Ig-like domain-containing protein [Candidatus Neomarinimicrobiota bacterium]